MVHQFIIWVSFVYFFADHFPLAPVFAIQQRFSTHTHNFIKLSREINSKFSHRIMAGSCGLSLFTRQRFITLWHMPQTMSREQLLFHAAITVEIIWKPYARSDELDSLRRHLVCTFRICIRKICRPEHTESSEWGTFTWLYVSILLFYSRYSQRCAPTFYISAAPFYYFSQLECELALLCAFWLEHTTDMVIPIFLNGS